MRASSYLNKNQTLITKQKSPSFRKNCPFSEEGDFEDDDPRGTTHFVPDCIDPFGGHQDNTHGIVGQLLSILQAINQVVLLIDDGCYKFGGIDIAATSLIICAQE